jgi:tetratricopeptide (TPR) repeat protein
MPLTRRGRALRRDVAAGIVLALAILGAYGQALNGPFQFDDYSVIVLNPAVHSLKGWFASMPGIRPLLKLSYMLNWVTLPEPVWFRLFNVTVHGINSVLVYGLLRQLRGRDATGDWVPLASALLFALHPVQTEAVTYLSGRSVSLMALFYLGSLLTWVTAGRAGRAELWRLASAILFAAALMVKETAVTLPLAILLLDKLFLCRNATPRELARRQALHWLILVAGLMGCAALPAYRRLLDASVHARGLGDNLLTQVSAVWYLAGQLLRPWGMNVDPDQAVIRSWTAVIGWQILVIAVLLGLAWWSRRRRPWLALAILWFFLHLLPTNSVLPRLDVANDRQLYLAALGAFVAASLGVQTMLERNRRAGLVLAACGLLVLGTLAAATVQRNAVYQSEIAFWEDAAMRSPHKPRVANNLGYAYQRAGRLDEARQAYRRAIALDPQYGKARINLEALEDSER